MILANSLLRAGPLERLVRLRVPRDEALRGFAVTEPDDGRLPGARRKADPDDSLPKTPPRLCTMGEGAPASKTQAWPAEATGLQGRKQAAG